MNRIPKLLSILVFFISSLSVSYAQSRGLENDLETFASIGNHPDRKVSFAEERLEQALESCPADAAAAIEAVVWMDRLEKSASSIDLHERERLDIRYAALDSLFSDGLSSCVYGLYRHRGKKLSEQEVETYLESIEASGEKYDAYASALSYVFGMPSAFFRMEPPCFSEVMASCMLWRTSSRRSRLKVLEFLSSVSDPAASASYRSESVSLEHDGNLAEEIDAFCRLAYSSETYAERLVYAYGRLLAERNLAYAKGDAELMRKVYDESVSVYGKYSSSASPLSVIASEIFRTFSHIADSSVTVRCVPAVACPDTVVTVIAETRNVRSLDIHVFRIDDGYVHDVVTDDILDGMEPDIVKQIDLSDSPFGLPTCTEIRIDGFEPGYYAVRAVCGDEVHVSTFRVTDVFYAERVRNGRAEIFVSDMSSGRPAVAATLRTYTRRYSMSGTSLVPVSVYDVRLDPDGFTDVTDFLSPGMNVFNVTSGSDIYTPVSYAYVNDDVSVAGSGISLFSDRPLYSFSDSVKVAAVLWENDENGAGRRLSEGKQVYLEILDPVGKSVWTDMQSSDMYGTVSSCFVPSSEMKAGTYRLYAEADGGAESVSFFRIEHARTPGAVVETDVSDRMEISDTLVWEGGFFTSSGMPLDGSTVDCRLVARPWSGNGTGPYSFSARVDVSDDGSFSFAVPSEELFCGDSVRSMSYVLEFNAVSPYGESVIRTVGGFASVNEYSLQCTIPQVVVPGYSDSVMLSVTDVSGKIYGDSVCVRLFDASDPDVCSFMRIEGEDVVPEHLFSCRPEKTFSVFSGEPFEISGIRDGKHVLLAESEVSGRRISVVRNFMYWNGNSVPPDDAGAVLVAGRQEKGKNISFIAGSAADTAYVLYELYDGYRVLRSGVLEVTGNHAVFDTGYPSVSSENVFLNIMSVHDGRMSAASSLYCAVDDRIRIVPADMPDKVVAGEDTVISFRILDNGNRPVHARAVVSVYDSLLDRFGVPYFALPDPSVPVLPGISSVLDGNVSVMDCGEKRGFAGGIPVRMSANMESGMQDSAMKDVCPADDGTAFREKSGGSLFFSAYVETDSEGFVRIPLKTDGLLTRYTVRVAAFDECVRSADIESAFTVYKPLSVQTVIPAMFFSGDSAVVVLSSFSETELADREFFFEVEADGSPVPAECVSESEETSSWSFTVPDCRSMEFRYGVSSGNYSDMVRETAAVMPSVEERISAKTVLLAPGDTVSWVGQDIRDSMSGVKVVSPAGMIMETFDSVHDPEDATFVSAIGSFLSSVLADEMQSAGKGKRFHRNVDERYPVTEDTIMEFMTEDGAFSWIRGGRPSPDMTVMFLEETAFLKRRGLVSGFVKLDSMAKSSMEFMEKYIQEGMDRKSLSADIVLRYMTAKADLPGELYPELSEWNADEMLAADSLVNVSGPYRLLLLASYAEAYGKQDLLSSAMSSLVSYAVFSDSYVFWPGFSSGTDGIESELSAHVRLCRLLRSISEDKLADGVMSWIMMQRGMYDWGNCYPSLKAACLVMDCGMDSGKASFRTDSGRNVVLGRHEHVWTGDMGASDGACLVNTGKLPLAVTFFSRKTCSVEEPSDGYDSVGISVSLSGNGMSGNVEYVLDSPLHMDYVVVRGMSSAGIVYLDELSSFRYSGGSQYYREVRPDGVYYYFERLPRGVVRIMERTAFRKNGVYSCRSALLREQ